MLHGHEEFERVGAKVLRLVAVFLDRLHLLVKILKTTSHAFAQLEGGKDERKKKKGRRNRQKLTFINRWRSPQPRKMNHLSFHWKDQRPSNNRASISKVCENRWWEIECCHRFTDLWPFCVQCYNQCAIEKLLKSINAIIHHWKKKLLLLNYKLFLNLTQLLTLAEISLGPIMDGQYPILSVSIFLLLPFSSPSPPPRGVLTNLSNSLNSVK